MSLVGLLNLNKPPGMTSREAVNWVDQLVRPERSGHAGTLDPLATGVLVVCVGSATRLIPYVQRMRKTYDATFRLGWQSDTDDIEGHVQEVDVPTPPDRSSLLAVLQRFRGPIQQVPPIYSAIKVKGRRAYQLAREQKSFQLAPREVQVYRLELVDYQFPVMRILVECSAGTYIRALGRDIAAACSTSAVMSALTRTAVGAFHLDNACPLAELTSESLSQHLLPPARAVSELSQLTVTPEEARRLCCGQVIARSCPAGEDECAVFAADGQLVAIAAPQGSSQLRPIKCFPPPA